jgi:hypothetical protein
MSRHLFWHDGLFVMIVQAVPQADDALFFQGSNQANHLLIRCCRLPNFAMRRQKVFYDWHPNFFSFYCSRFYTVDDISQWFCAAFGTLALGVFELSILFLHSL